MTTSPLKSPEAMNKLKTPEELGMIAFPPLTDTEITGMPAEIDCNESCRENYAAGISYTREHEVKPLVEVLLMVAKSDSFVRINGAAQKAVNEALTLYTNEVK